MAVEIPLPPLAEQRRIMGKVEVVLASVNAARERLAKVPALLKRFRQSTLAAACSGKLTAEWRQANPNVEPASRLIEKIAEVRARQNGAHNRRKTIDSETDVSEKPIDLSELWVRCRADEIASIGLGGTPSRELPDYWGAGTFRG